MLLDACRADALKFRTSPEVSLVIDQNISFFAELLAATHDGSLLDGAVASYRVNKAVNEVILSGKVGLHSFVAQLTAESSCLEVDGNVVWFYDVMGGEPLGEAFASFFSELDKLKC